MATAASAKPKDHEQHVRIQEPVKEPKHRPPPLDVSMTSTSSGPKTPGSMTPRPHERDRKIGHRRVDDTGQVTYKKKPTTEIKEALQLGLEQSIGCLTSKQQRDVLLQDFSLVESVFFPREGSNLTPAHHYSDFRFKTYAPIAFRYFRELFGIQPDDFLLSLCNEQLRELSNPGASGSIFYITNDDEFIIKTVQHKEAEFLQKLLPGYYMNLNQNPRTLLPKFYGLYCYQCGGKNIRFVVMNNLLPSSIKMHEKYDMKGSTYKRKASKREQKKSNPTWKDLDYMELHAEGLMLEADTYSALVKTIERDCRVLQSFKIMDYSLLLGVHNLDQAIRDRTEPDPNGAGPSTGGQDAAAANAANAFSRGRSMKQRIAAFSTAMEAIQASSEPVEIDNEDVPTGGIPARNTRGERLLLYIGIIDILQSYRLQKKLEHVMKAMVYDGDTISVHRPGFYATRFQTFYANTVFKKIPSSLKHSPSKKKGTQRQRSVTTSEVEGRTVERAPFERARAQTSLDDSDTAGAMGGRPDLLPTTSTPPPTFAEAMATQEPSSYTSLHSSSTSQTVLTTKISSMHSSRLSTDRHDVVTTSTASFHSGGSPAHSISESTPTHTEYTEDTPQFSGRAVSYTAGQGATDISISSEQIELEISGAGRSLIEDGPKRGSTTASVADSGMGTLGSNDSQPDTQVEHVTHL